MKHRIFATSFAILIHWGASPSRAAAQIDYRNLDHERPSRVTDAYPVERRAFEFSLPYGIRVDGGEISHLTRPSLDYGIGRNLMVGLGAELETGAVDDGSAVASLLWNARRETVSLPGLSLVAEVLTDFDQASFEVGGLFTRALGRSRIHGNFMVRAANTSNRLAPLAADWWAGLAWDYTLIRSSTLLVFDLVTERMPGGETEWGLGGGARRQLTPTLVLFGGARQSLRGPGTEMSLGLSHAFALAGLTPRLRRSR